MTTNYGTATNYKAFQLARTNVVVTASDAAITAALLVASEWIDGKYRFLFPGQRTALRAQDREWPRNAAFDYDGQTIASDVVPIEVENATYIVAAQELASPGSLTTNAALGTTVTSVRVEGAVDVTFAGVANVDDLQLEMPDAEQALTPILTGENYGGSPSLLSGRSVRV